MSVPVEEPSLHLDPHNAVGGVDKGNRTEHVVAQQDDIIETGRDGGAFVEVLGVPVAGERPLRTIAGVRMARQSIRDDL